ncbi:hypothetical protein ACJQWK_07477 [Exserohilum turcicum]
MAQQLQTREIPEYDDSGNLARTYVVSVAGDGRRDNKTRQDTDADPDKTKSRIDIITPQHRKNYVQLVVDIFLPVGFPHSVTEDYVAYQIFDSLQAFSSSIAGMLASRAVLQGKRGILLLLSCYPVTCTFVPCQLST